MKDMLTAIQAKRHAKRPQKGEIKSAGEPEAGPTRAAVALQGGLAAKVIAKRNPIPMAEGGEVPEEDDLYLDADPEVLEEPEEVVDPQEERRSRIAGIMREIGKQHFGK